MPKISVIIPVDTTQEKLHLCLESVRNQTLKDIEIICVDNGSQDGSSMILEQFAQKDNRIKMIRAEKNRGLMASRADGVACAEGEYILFLESGDSLEPAACEMLYDKIIQEQADILHFTTRVINDSSVNANDSKNVNPYPKSLTGTQVFREGFLGKKVWGAVWDKIYKTELLKKAFSHADDDCIHAGEDIYILCLISCFAQSYFGWESEALYNRCDFKKCFDSKQDVLEMLEQHCIHAVVIQQMVSFCQIQGVMDDAKGLFEELHQKWSDECFDIWMNSLPKAHAVEGWEMMCRYWGVKEAVSVFARHYFANSSLVATKLSHLPGISLKEKNIRTVAFYHWKLNEGGIERVVSVLAPMMQKMGYRVVVITDDPEAPNDYPIPDEISRVQIVHYTKVDGQSIKARLDNWERILEQYDIDVVLYNNWMSQIFFWDMLYLKAKGIPVVVHIHGVYTFIMNTNPQMLCRQVKELPLADALVTLSQEDTEFWKLFSGNVHYIPNPAAQNLNGVNFGKWENKSIIWVGRASYEKQPEAIFEIMELVAAQEPEAKLYVLGDFYDSRWKNRIIRKGLTDKVVLCGMVKNVSEYLEKATVYTCTSRYEGFPMSLVEAQAHGLPTVMFRLSHLTMAAPGRGVVSVDMDDYASAANEIVRLLRDKESWELASYQAKESFLWLRDYDLEAAWQKVLTSQQLDRKKEPALENVMNQLIESFLTQCNKPDGVGILAWLRRKVMRIVQCLREDGLAYTIRLSIQRLKEE